MNEEQKNKARGCECLAKLDKQVKQSHGEDCELQLAPYMLTDPEAEQWESYGDLPPLFFKWKEKGKVRKSHFPFNFCPFCGVKKP